ncbi:MAG: type II toxin-antitoxin system Phd/YefM family antitoxin [Candidatus Gracilibacteria bacterium]|nr:type II toxin-antitoxin system Phd/YefM family antitoxin [Candidatus Gracilibacteria bacterium]
METLTATIVQKNFGAVMRKIGRSPVFVSQHGEPRAVILGLEDFRDLIDGKMATIAYESRDFLSVEESTDFIASLARHA